MVCISNFIVLLDWGSSLGPCLAVGQINVYRHISRDTDDRMIGVFVVGFMFLSSVLLVRRKKTTYTAYFLERHSLSSFFLVFLAVSKVPLFSCADTSIDENFRLFLSSMPTKVFPVTVLQNSVKVITHTHTPTHLVPL